MRHTYVHGRFSQGSRRAGSLRFRRNMLIGRSRRDCWVRPNIAGPRAAPPNSLFAQHSISLPQGYLGIVRERAVAGRVNCSGASTWTSLVPLLLRRTRGRSRTYEFHRTPEHGVLWGDDPTLVDCLTCIGRAEQYRWV